MKLKKIYITNFLILLPFLMVFIAEMMQISFSSLSGKIKVLSALYMLVYVFFKRSLNISLLISFLIFLPFLLYGIIHTFNIKAGIEESIRYLFPIIILFYSYSIRRHYKLLFTSLIIFVLINDFWQIINYINWARGEIQWFYLNKNGFRYYNSSSGIIRATGVLVFFGLFGFLNAFSFFIIYKYYNNRFKTFLLIITALFVLLSFSYKVIGPFLLILFLAYKNKVKIISIIGLAFFGAIILIPEKMQSISYNIASRLKAYIFEGNSARSESYRLMFKEIFNFNLFGRGVGSFGGPASTTYNSPVYELVKFNWYKTPGMATTDTFYPHVFIELGIIGGILYFFIILIPIIRTTSLKKMDIIYIIYSLLFFDAIFSFSLNNIAYLMTSLVLIYPIIEYEKLKL